MKLYPLKLLFNYDRNLYLSFTNFVKRYKLVEFSFSKARIKTYDKRIVDETYTSLSLNDIKKVFSFFKKEIKKNLPRPTLERVFKVIENFIKEQECKSLKS